MSNSTNSRLRSMVIAIAAGILVVALGTPASAASHPAQLAGGSATLNASGGPLPVDAVSNSKTNNNGNANGHKHKLELPRNLFELGFGAVSSVIRSIVATSQTTSTTTVGATGMTAYDPDAF